MKQIILIDAYAQIYRSFFALRGLSNQQGEPVNALYGMARFLLGLDEHLGSDYGAAVFDKGKCKRRIRILPQYKAQRPPMPDALRAQVEPIRVWMQAFGWPLLEQEGLEADDIIGCIASQSEELPLGILSYDKDLAQLVNARVSLLQPGKNNSWLRQGVQEVQEKFGVRPEQIVDYLALLGDASDNIPGVPGVGPKTAAKLLGQFGSIEKLLANLGEAGGARLQENLEQSVELLQRNRELVRLELDCLPNWQGAESIRRSAPDWPKIRELALEQGFKSLLPGIERKLGDSDPRQLDLF